MGAIGAEISDDPDSLNSQKGGRDSLDKDGNEKNDKIENQGPSRETFMDPYFGGFYDDLAAAPPSENLHGDRPFERGI